MCPECGEHMDHLIRFNVWLCPTCDYGETDELHEQRDHDGDWPERLENDGLRNLIHTPNPTPGWRTATNTAAGIDEAMGTAIRFLQENDARPNIDILNGETMVPVELARGEYVNVRVENDAHGRRFLDEVRERARNNAPALAYEGLQELADELAPEDL